MSTAAVLFGCAAVVLVIGAGIGVDGQFGFDAIRVRRTRAKVLASIDPAHVGGPASAGQPRPRRAMIEAARIVADPVLAPVGGFLRRVVRRRPDPDADRRTGGVVLAGAVSFVFGGWPAATVIGGAVAMGPVVRRRSAHRRHRAAVHADLPEVVDLLCLGVSSGLNLHLAVAAVADASDSAGPVTAALVAVGQRVAAGERLVDALGELSMLGEPVRPLHDALVAAERHGVPLTVTLDRIAAESRTSRRRRHEEAARRLPVRLLFPLVLCALPAVLVLTVVPLVATSVPSLVP